MFYNQVVVAGVWLNHLFALASFILNDATPSAPAPAQQLWPRPCSSNEQKRKLLTVDTLV